MCPPTPQPLTSRKAMLSKPCPLPCSSSILSRLPLLFHRQQVAASSSSSRRVLTTPATTPMVDTGRGLLLLLLLSAKAKKERRERLPTRSGWHLQGSAHGCDLAAAEGLTFRLPCLGRGTVRPSCVVEIVQRNHPGAHPGSTAGLQDDLKGRDLRSGSEGQDGRPTQGTEAGGGGDSQRARDPSKDCMQDQVEGHRVAPNSEEAVREADAWGSKAGSQDLALPAASSFRSREGG